MAVTESRALRVPAAPGPRPARPTGTLAEIRRHWADYVYILPALAAMLLVIGYPIYYTIYLSFFDTPPSSSEWYFTGADNYGRVLTDSGIGFWDITKNTASWTILSTLFAFAIGF